MDSNRSKVTLVRAISSSLSNFPLLNNKLFELHLERHKLEQS